MWLTWLVRLLTPTLNEMRYRDCALGGAAAPTRISPPTDVIEIPGGGGVFRWPNPSEYEVFRLTFISPSPRSVLRVRPAGRSLKIRSPLSSVPVRMVYGEADEWFIDRKKFRFFNAWLFTPTLTR